GAALYLQVMPTAPAVGDHAGLVPASVPIVLEAGKVQRAVGGNLRGDSQQLVAQGGTAPLREKGVTQGPAHGKGRLVALRLGAGQRLESRPEGDRPLPVGPRPGPNGQLRLDLPQQPDLGVHYWL